MNRSKPQTLQISVLIFLSILLIVLDAQFHVLNKVHAVGERLALPLRLSAAWPGMLVDNLSGYFADKTQLIKQNELLQQTIVRQQVQLQALSQLQASDQALKSVLNLKNTLHLPLTVTRLLDAKGYPYLEQLFIQHSDDAVDINSAVLAPDGVVGQVISSNGAMDTVLPIVNTASYVPVQLAGAALRAVAQGDGKNGLLIQQVASSNTVNVGATFVTSGLGGVYPVGYPVGTVVGIEPSTNPIFLTLVLKPAANLSTLDYVAVLAQGKEHA